MKKYQQKSIALKDVTVNDTFWSKFQSLVIDTVIPYQLDILEDKVEGAEKSHALSCQRKAVP